MILSPATTIKYENAVKRSKGVASVLPSKVPPKVTFNLYMCSFVTLLVAQNIDFFGRRRELGFLVRGDKK